MNNQKDGAVCMVAEWPHDKSVRGEQGKSEKEKAKTLNIKNTEAILVVEKEKAYEAEFKLCGHVSKGEETFTGCARRSRWHYRSTKN